MGLLVTSQPAKEVPDDGCAIDHEFASRGETECDRVPLKRYTGCRREDDLCEHARQAFESGAQFLLLDMQGLSFISSAGLRALHNVFKMCTPEGEFEAARESGEPYKSPYFKLAGASPDVYYVLNLAGFLHNIPFYPTMEDALNSFE